MQKGIEAMNKELEMVRLACKALDEKKALDIKVIDIHEVSVIADYFVIASGSNLNQVQAMVDNVQEELFKAGYEMKQMEGYREGNWILLDFGDIIIHIFDKENRLFYDLERIWSDGRKIDLTGWRS
mgnify:CR=1 FL=1